MRTKEMLNWRAQLEEPTYCTGQLSSSLLKQAYDLSLLGWSTSATDHCWALASQFHKFVLVVFQAHLFRETDKQGYGACNLSLPSPNTQAAVTTTRIILATSHLQRITRDHKGTVVLATEGVQFQVSFSTVGHLRKDQLHNVKCNLGVGGDFPEIRILTS